MYVAGNDGCQRRGCTTSTSTKEEESPKQPKVNSDYGLKSKKYAGPYIPYTIRAVCWFTEPRADRPYQNIFFVFPSLNKQFFIQRLLHVDICMTLRHEHLNYPRKVESGICYKFVDWMAVVCLLVGRPHMLLLGEYSLSPPMNYTKLN